MISPTVATAISELATPVLFGSLAGLALGISAAMALFSRLSLNASPVRRALPT
jgi:hypothetical protein